MRLYFIFLFLVLLLLLLLFRIVALLIIFFFQSIFICLNNFFFVCFGFCFSQHHIPIIWKLETKRNLHSMLTTNQNMFGFLYNYRLYIVQEVCSQRTLQKGLWCIHKSQRNLTFQIIFMLVPDLNPKCYLPACCLHCVIKVNSLTFTKSP